MFGFNITRHTGLVNSGVSLAHCSQHKHNRVGALTTYKQHFAPYPLGNWVVVCSVMGKYILQNITFSQGRID